MLSVVKSSAKFHPLDPADFGSPVMRQMLLSSYPVSPFDALKRLINSDREFQQARRSHDLTTLMSYYRQIRRPVAVFVDTIDEYFEGYVDSGDPHEADASYLHRNKDSRIWIVGQLGICRAIRELLGVNPHVKIFVSIRKEAFNSLDYYDRNAVNISSLAVQLHYSGEDLSRIFDKNIIGHLPVQLVQHQRIDRAEFLALPVVDRGPNDLVGGYQVEGLIRGDRNCSVFHKTLLIGIKLERQSVSSRSFPPPGEPLEPRGPRAPERRNPATRFNPEGDLPWRHGLPGGVI